jgi:hypothetical protein
MLNAANAVHDNVAKFDFTPAPLSPSLLPHSPDIKVVGPVLDF